MCEAAAKKLGVESLRDVTDAQAGHLELTDEEKGCVRHVVTENQRTLEAAEASHPAELYAQLIKSSELSFFHTFVLLEALAKSRRGDHTFPLLSGVIIIYEFQARPAHTFKIQRGY